MKLLHTMIRVKDAEASLKFYTELLNMKLDKKKRLDDCWLYFLTDEDGTTQLELTYNDETPEGGYELGSGSVRIYNQEMQKKVFERIGLTEQDISNKFGFFVEALKYGTPPHMGMAVGLERIVMILTGTSNIRDVVAFPKIQSAADLMNECPSPVDEEALNMLGIKVK